MVERGAAPAPVSRTHRSGRPRVTVRPNYVGLPIPGLDEGRTSGAKAPRWGGRRVRCPTPEARSRGHKTPRWSAGRRRAPRRGAHAARRRLETTAPFGAPPPHLLREELKARPAPLNSPGL